MNWWGGAGNARLIRRDGVVGSGNHSLPRYYLHLLRSVKSSNDPRIPLGAWFDQDTGVALEP
jgi:hypothetical protein